jgi:hypothetical protein
MPIAHDKSPGDAHVAFAGVAACSVLAALLLCFVAGKSAFTGLFSDSAIYLLLADALLSKDPNFDWLTFLFERYPFPPLYPVFLAVLGGGSGAAHWTHTIGALTLAACAGAIVLWWWRERIPVLIACGAALVFTLAPVTLFSAMDIFSEPLYVLLTLTAMIALTPDAPRRSAWYTAALALGLAGIVRTVGITAIVAFIVHWWWCTRGRRYRATPFLALLPTLAWAAIKWLRDYDSSYVLTVIRFPLRETLPALLTEIPSNLAALWEHGRASLDVVGHPAAGVLLGVLLAFAAAGFLARVAARRFDALYLAAYGALILVWPHSEHAGRFLFVIMPIMGLQATYAALTLARAVHGARLRQAITALPLLLAVALIAPSGSVIMVTIARFSDGAYHDAVRTEAWHRRANDGIARTEADIVREMTAAIVALGERVEAGAFITSVYPQTVMLLTRRPGLFPAAADASAPVFDASMRACPYALLLNSTSDSFGYPEHFYPRARLAGNFSIVAEVHYRNVPPAPAIAALLVRVH